MTAPTVTSFRVAFPEFANPGKYPDPQLSFWLALSGRLVNAARWGDLADYGQYLFIAHNLSLQAASSGARAGIPGLITGPVTSGSVDKVSYSRDVQSAMLPGAGHWNLSTYGLRYKSLVAMVGAGPLQVGVGDPGTGSGVWNGPWQSQVPNQSN